MRSWWRLVFSALVCELGDWPVMGVVLSGPSKHSICLSAVSSLEPPDASRQRLCPQQSWGPEGASGQMPWPFRLPLGLLGLRLFQPRDSGFCRPAVTAGGSSSNMLLEKRGGSRRGLRLWDPRRWQRLPQGDSVRGRGQR